jgi:hypothetical protein
MKKRVKVEWKQNRSQEKQKVFVKVRICMRVRKCQIGNNDWKRENIMEK